MQGKDKDTNCLRLHAVSITCHAGHLHSLSVMLNKSQHSEASMHQIPCYCSE